MKVPEEEILEAQVIMTIVNGKIVFEDKKKGT
jgi:predicted amidohydrolase YtcJ